MEAFIMTLLAAILPVIAKALVEWITNLFNRAAKRVKIGSDASDEEKADALFEEALKLTPRTRPGRRILLKILRKRVIDDQGRLKKKLDSDDKEELKDAIAAAKKD